MQTNSTQYVVSHDVNALYSSALTKFVMTWAKDDAIRLYINTNLVAEHYGYPLHINKTSITEQEYFLLFGQYYFSFSYLFASLTKLQVWRKPLSQSEIQSYIPGKCIPYY